jgi:hypothetical protein
VAGVGSAVLLERAPRIAPLGIRFFDPVGGHYVSDLTITARPAVRQAGGGLPLYANPSGVFVLHGGVPIMRNLENAQAARLADADASNDFPPPTDYVLTVADPFNRFLPFTLRVGVPTFGLVVWHAGAVSPVESVNGEPPGDVPLFSAPGRLPAEGKAIVYARLFDALANRPAAWALLEIRAANGLFGRGLSDERGQVAVCMSYPPPLGSLQASPPSPPTGTSLWAQMWSVEVQVAYSPGLVAMSADGLPDLAAALAQLWQPPADAWTDSGRTVLLTSATLKFGQELVLRTSGMSRLLVTPAGSPP